MYCIRNITNAKVASPRAYLMSCVDFKKLPICYQYVHVHMMNNWFKLVWKKNLINIFHKNKSQNRDVDKSTNYQNLLKGSWEEGKPMGPFSVVLCCIRIYRTVVVLSIVKKAKQSMYQQMTPITEQCVLVNTQIYKTIHNGSWEQGQWMVSLTIPTFVYQIYWSSTQNKKHLSCWKSCGFFYDYCLSRKMLALYDSSINVALNSTKCSHRVKRHATLD